mgnify:CR=1 FL=1
MSEEPDILGAAKTGCLQISREGGRILDCSAVAAQLLGAGVDDLRGAPWREIFTDTQCAEQLARALEDPFRTPLAPFILDRPADGEVVLSGMPTALRLWQPWKALRPIEVRPGGITTDVMPVQKRNA